MTEPQVELKAISEKPLKAKKAEIPDGLAYVNAPGQLKEVLEKIIIASKPDKLTLNYLADVWNFKSSTFRQVHSSLKKFGFLEGDGKPTDLYSKFRSDTNRSDAALAALRQGFPDVFKVREYAHKIGDKEVFDTLVELTGREKSDQTLKAIAGTFRTIASYVGEDLATHSKSNDVDPEYQPDHQSKGASLINQRDVNGISLAYNINIILPESTNIEVFNVIFRSLRENLMR